MFVRGGQSQRPEGISYRGKERFWREALHHSRLMKGDSGIRACNIVPKASRIWGECWRPGGWRDREKAGISPNVVLVHPPWKTLNIH